jgi:uncharacterized membrane protein YkoI
MIGMPRISLQEAAQIALQALPGQLLRVELDTENGRLVYEVDIRTNYGIYEIVIDAYTGSIIDMDR